MPLLLEKDVRELGRIYLERLANIRRLGRALAMSHDNDVGTPEEYEHSDFRGRGIENPDSEGMDREDTGMEATIQVNKPYKPRRLKQDPAHRTQRRVMKKVRKTPQWKQRHKRVVKKYMQKFGRQLKKRSQKVHQIRQQRHLD